MEILMSNPNKTPKTLTVFGEMIADMLSSKKLQPVVTDFFIRGRKINISFVFITQYSFATTRNIRINSKHNFIMKIPNKRKLHQIAIYHSKLILKTL